MKLLFGLYTFLILQAIQIDRQYVDGNTISLLGQKDKIINIVSISKVPCYLN